MTGRAPRWASRIGVAFVATALSFTITTPAHAQTTQIDIQSDHVPTTAEDFQPDDQECDGPFEDLPDDVDGWHFVLPSSSGDAFESLTLEFSTPGGPTPVTVDSTDPGNPSSNDAWSGYLDGMHAWVVTEAGWTLESAAAEVSRDPGGDYSQDFFNLSHTCPGEPDNGPTPTPTPEPTPTPTAAPTPTPTPTATASPEPTPDKMAKKPVPPGKPHLPATGAQTAVLVGLGAFLVAAGAGVLALRRRDSLPGTSDG